jgi:hypothetical protein
MPEEPENWWEADPDEDKQDDTDPPEPIAIRGYQREGDQWVQKAKEEGDGPSEGDPTEWSVYSMQKAAVTGVFLFTFLVGDWWWDGSNGVGALFQTVSAISDWPYRYSWVSDFHPNPIILLISWALWDITPAVFLASFLFGSNIVYSTNLKEDSSEIRRIGKKAHRNLKFFVVALILMDFVAFSTDPWYPIVEYPILFFENRPGVYWMVIAFGASFGLDPDNERFAEVMKGLTPK